MKAYVKNGLLDKILNTPPGGTLKISRIESLLVLNSIAIGIIRGGVEIKTSLVATGRCILLGRNLEIKDE